MTSQELGALLSQQERLVRAEYSLSQEKMADLLGLSKKTLIQVEKGRSFLSWSSAVALCALFRESAVLRSALGDEPMEVIRIVAFSGLTEPKGRTMGGQIWWRDLRCSGGFRLQQNLVSGHYRILDEENRRWFSSFDPEQTQERFITLTQLPPDVSPC